MTERSIGVFEMPHILRWLQDIHAVIDEARVSLQDGMLSATFVDPAHISMHSTRCPAKQVGDATGTLGVNIRDTLDIVRRDFGKLDELEMRVGNDCLVMESPGRIRRIMLVDLNSLGDLKSPNIEYETQVKFDASDMHASISSFDKIADHVRITVSGGQLLVGTETDPTTGEFDARSGQDVIPAATSGPDCSALFSTDVLLGYVFPKHRAGNVVMELRDDHPLRAIFDHSEHFLSPRTYNG